VDEDDQDTGSDDQGQNDAQLANNNASDTITSTSNLALIGTGIVSLCVVAVCVIYCCRAIARKRKKESSKELDNVAEHVVDTDDRKMLVNGPGLAAVASMSGSVQQQIMHEIVSVTEGNMMTRGGVDVYAPGSPSSRNDVGLQYAAGNAEQVNLEMEGGENNENDDAGSDGEEDAILPAGVAQTKGVDDMDANERAIPMGMTKGGPDSQQGDDDDEVVGPPPPPPIPMKGENNDDDAASDDEGGRDVDENELLPSSCITTKGE